MWVDFCLAVLTGTAVLYGPGFFAWRALGMRGLAALSCAPLFSILAYSILGVVYFFLGVRSTALSVGLSVAVVSLAAYGLLLFVARRKGVALGSGERADRQFDAADRCDGDERDGEVQKAEHDFLKREQHLVDADLLDEGGRVDDGAHGS